MLSNFKIFKLCLLITIFLGSNSFAGDSQGDPTLNKMTDFFMQKKSDENSINFNPRLALFPDNPPGTITTADWTPMKAELSGTKNAMYKDLEKQIGAIRAEQNPPEVEKQKIKGAISESQQKWLTERVSIQSSYDTRGYTKKGGSTEGIRELRAQDGPKQPLDKIQQQKKSLRRAKAAKSLKNNK
jgi:hypothetical protein